MAIQYQAWPVGHLPWVRVLTATTAALCATFYVVWRAPLPYLQGWWQPEVSLLNLRDDDFAKRHRIADGFVLTGYLTGKTRTEVEALLGKPSGGGSSFHAHLVYFLGTPRSVAKSGGEWLLIDIGQDDRVVSARIASE
jgi:hypothetical protein